MADDIRVAVLAETARNTEAALLRMETQLARIEARQADDFKFLVRMHILQFVGLATGILMVLGVIARAQHWI
jgi:hypothetical protein